MALRLIPFLILGWAFSVQAEDFRYVTDQLRLSLYEQADAKSNVLRLLNSGHRLDVLEQAGPYARVKTEQGEEGWVKRGFLQTSATANIQVAELESEMQKMQAELERTADSRAIIEAAQVRNQELQTEKEALQQRMAAEMSNLEQLQQQLQQAQQQSQELAEAMLQQETRVDLPQTLRAFGAYLGAAAVLLLLLGILMGKLAAESRIRRHFNGVRVW